MLVFEFFFLVVTRFYMSSLGVLFTWIYAALYGIFWRVFYLVLSGYMVSVLACFYLVLRGYLVAVISRFLTWIYTVLYYFWRVFLLGFTRLFGVSFFYFVIGGYLVLVMACFFTSFYAVLVLLGPSVVLACF